MQAYEGKCGYFDDEVSLFIVCESEDLRGVDMSDKESVEDAKVVCDMLLDSGFRRSGDMYYNNICPHCKKCQSILVPVAEFMPSKSQRRVIKRNEDLKIITTQAVATDEKFELFKKYCLERHESEDMATRECFDGLYNGYSNIIEMSYYLEDRLVGVGILDVGNIYVSTTYFYFDPSEDLKMRSLGVFSAIKEIEYAKEFGYPYYHLGYYIEDCKKMNYKTNFRPYEIIHR